METIKAKLSVWSKNRALVRIIAAVLGVLLILMVWLCISINMRTNIQKKYTNTISQMQAQAYQNLNTMTQLFARIDDPNVDVRNKLIPELKAQYTSAAAISNVLNTSAPARAAVLTPEQIAAFDAAFKLYAECYRNGTATGLAQADMALCMAEVQEMVNKYFKPEDDAKDDVVIINASSGKIENPQPEQQ